MIEKLFFELIRVSLGTQECLSRTPSAAEWGKLYDMAKKQSLVGVCFAGVQRLVNQHQEPEELLYLTWMGMAAKIQQRNEVVNRQCAELQARLSADGLNSCILKGQGIASLYHSNSSNLSLLRQSGDIDVWVDGGMEKTMRYAKSQCGAVEFDYINAHLPVLDDPSAGSGQGTEVELHWRVSQMQNLWKNRRLQRWTVEHKEDLLKENVALPNGEEVTVPTIEFNAFYILLHIYDHEFAEGIGMRQLMDYYFVLRSELNESARQRVNQTIAEFGMTRFASGIMWIMKDVFGLSDQQMIVDPNEREGRFLLDEIMQNGNFGHHDERIKQVGSGKMAYFWKSLQHNMHLSTHYPSAFFWQPIWLVFHFFWKRLWKMKHKELVV